eukprot:COSAG06_NODE_35397_length_460_cov_1.349030_2_plen_87_part_01
MGLYSKPLFNTKTGRPSWSQKNRSRLTNVLSWEGLGSTREDGELVEPVPHIPYYYYYYYDPCMRIVLRVRRTWRFYCYNLGPFILCM